MLLNSSMKKFRLSGNFNYNNVEPTGFSERSNVSGLLLGAWRTPPDFNNLP